MPRVNDKKVINLTGRVFGRLTVIKKIEETFGPNGARKWLCKCECGKEVEVKGSLLRCGSTRSCKCLQTDMSYFIRLKPHGVAASNHLYGNYLRGAKNRGIEFGISKEDFLALAVLPCKYCGAPPSQVHATKGLNGSFTYSGVDRVDSSKGYTVDNCVPCCKDCNYAKRLMTVPEFLNWARRIVSNNPA